ncbi:MAG: hypothetical protein KDG50_02075 [Chromatiales bacterium]|nr:hypothetical protein [Chromatiales bacterium]
MTGHDAPANDAPARTTAVGSEFPGAQNRTTIFDGGQRLKIRKTLNNAEFPAAQESAAIFGDCRPLKMQESEKSHVFGFAAQAILDGLIRGSVQKTKNPASLILLP